MMEEKYLAAHLKERPVQLEKAKKDGTKIVGYFPGNYVPEEIIYASGAIPLCLMKGGSSSNAEAALSVVPQVICPFARAQIGQRMLKEDPYYNMLDMLVAPITCQHLKKVAEIWEYYNEIEIFKLGIPHQQGIDFGLDYFTERLTVLKDRIQKFTGNEITDKKLGDAIDLYNRMRGLIRNISLMRRSPNATISGLDFIKLNHASFYADPVFMVDFLEGVYKELKEKQGNNTDGASRILLLGPNISDGDYMILELLEKSGGKIVMEDIYEGIRYYWNDIENGGNLFSSLAKGYLEDRVPCALMRNSAGKRLDFALKLINDFNVSGIIWYELLCCETYDSESYFFAQRMREQNMPMLVLESDYGSTASTGQLKTRIEAFMEILKGVIE